MKIHEALKAVAEICRKGCRYCSYLDELSGECMVARKIEKDGGLERVDEVEWGRKEDDEI